MQHTDINISVVIPTHNRSDALAKTLEELARQNFDGSWEVVVVNNNCTDETDAVVEAARRSFSVALTLAHERTPGPAATRNAGALAARGEYLIFIDNDILTAPDFVDRHYRRLRENPGCWIVGQIVNLPEQEATVFGKYRKTLFPETPVDAGLSEIDGITGQTTSMARAEFLKLDGFDKNFFVASGEDRELALRARAAGIKILFDPGIVVKHNDWAGTTIRDFCRRHRLYTQTEPFFWQKYGDQTPRLEMVKRNLPPRLEKDGLKLFVWKNFKRLLGSDPGQRAIIGACEVMEKVVPDSGLLRRFYRLAIAGAIYRGFQEGLQIKAAK